MPPTKLVQIRTLPTNKEAASDSDSVLFGRGLFESKRSVCE